MAEDSSAVARSAGGANAPQFTTSTILMPNGIPQFNKIGTKSQ
jgi:hypothetical protein